jgi:hypothetical protein
MLSDHTENKSDIFPSQQLPLDAFTEVISNLDTTDMLAMRRVNKIFLCAVDRLLCEQLNQHSLQHLALITKLIDVAHQSAELNLPCITSISGGTC